MSMLGDIINFLAVLDVSLNDGRRARRKLVTSLECRIYSRACN